MSAQAELERKLSSLVKQRMAGFDYMRRVGTGERHWLSTVSLGDQEAGLAKAVDPDVVLKWYFLGLSFAPLLQLASGATFVKAVAQLLEEYAYHFAKGVDSRRATRARGRAPPASAAAGDDDVVLKPALQRSRGDVVYVYLLTQHTPHALSASVVLQCFCELMQSVYRKFGECAASGATAALVDAIVKADATLEEQVLAPVTKHFNASALALGRAALGRVDPLFSKVMEGATSGIDEDG